MAKNTAHNHAATRTLPPVAPWAWAVLAAILALGAVLRGARLTDAPGGYLVFNEGFYIDAGFINAKRALFAWFYAPTEVNKPPLYQGLVSMLYRLHLPEVASARAISVLAGLTTIVFVFMLARLLFGQSTGLVAAAALAAMPGVVMVDHNIQTDALLVALIVGSVYFYVLAAGTRRNWHAVVGGVLLGIGMLTKEPAFLALAALAAWETWRTHGLAWARERRVWWFAGLALAVGGSWYLLQLAIAPATWFSAMFGGAGLAREAMTGLGLNFWEMAVKETPWMLFPLTALLAVGGLVYAGWQRKTGDKLVLVFSATFLAYFIAVHFHSYYLLPTAPFLAIAVARLSTGFFAEKIPWAWARFALVGGLVAAMTLGSLVMLGGQKWGYWSPTAFDPQPGAGFSAVHLYYDKELEGFFGPTMRHLAPQLKATPATIADFMNAPHKPGEQDLFLGTTYADSSGKSAMPTAPLRDTWLRPVLFGFALGETDGVVTERPHASQQFTNMNWVAERVGPLWRFGMRPTQIESGFYLYDRKSFK